MHFVYEGFTHNGGTRRFLFTGVEERHPTSTYSIDIALLMFTENRVAVQDGPMFCLQLLTAASLLGAGHLEKFQHYQVVGNDFRPLIVERERAAAEKALRKPPHRPLRKPPISSNLRSVGRPPE